MTRRRVTKTRKDAEGDILALCNPGSAWSPRAKAIAIADIETGAHEYYVKSGDTVVDVHVVNGPTGKYLRTTADKKSPNNLDNLPNC